MTAGEGKHLGIESILKVKLKWKVAAMALIVQMKNTGVISEWQYKTLIIAASKMGLRTSEINGIEKESSLVIQKILEILKTDGVTLSKLALNLDLPVDEVSSLLFKFHVVSNEQSLLKKTIDTPKPVLRLVE